MQIFFDKAQSLFVDPEDDIKHVKHCIEVSLTSHNVDPGTCL